MWKYLILTIFLFSCSNNSNSNTDAPPSEAQKEVPVENPTSANEESVPNQFSIKTFQGDKGWGYDIFIGEKKYIHQPHKPAVGGNEGFINEQQAQKVAELALDKIKNGIMPPSLSSEEVDSIMSIYQ